MTQTAKGSVGPKEKASPKEKTNQDAIPPRGANQRVATARRRASGRFLYTNPPKGRMSPNEITPRTEKGKMVMTVPAKPRSPPASMSIPPTRSRSIVGIRFRRAGASAEGHPRTVSIPPGSRCPGARRSMEGLGLVSASIRPRLGDLLSFHRERLGVDAPVIDGAVNLVRRERRDRSEESEEITKACVEGPTRTRVAFIRAGFHHLHVMRREQVPKELPAAVRGHEEVQVLVGCARGLHQMVQFREDPFVGRK